jgi:hypothetical protein
VAELAVVAAIPESLLVEPIPAILLIVAMVRAVLALKAVLAVLAVLAALAALAAMLLRNLCLRGSCVTLHKNRALGSLKFIHLLEINHGK